MSDEEFDEENYRAYEDELYCQSSSESENDGIDSEIEDTLYSQVHYSFSLPQTKEQTDKEGAHTPEIIEVSSQTEQDSNNSFAIEENELERSSIITISSDESGLIEADDSSPKENWDLDDKDLDDGSNNGSSKYGSRYYKTPKKLQHMRCHNCNEKGHMASDCPDPKKIFKCSLCGGKGHVRRSCPNELCFNCDEPGHQSRSCRKPRRRTYDRCHRCFFGGHLISDCPDLWRQYHRTIKTGNIVKPRESPAVPVRPVYCYNCAKQGHYGHECTEDRMEPRQAASFPFIVQYDGCASANARRSQGCATRKGSDLGKGSCRDSMPRGRKPNKWARDVREDRNVRDSKLTNTEKLSFTLDERDNRTGGNMKAKRSRKRKRALDSSTPNAYDYPDKDLSFGSEHSRGYEYSRGSPGTSPGRDDRRWSWPSHKRQRYNEDNGEYLEYSVKTGAREKYHSPAARRLHDKAKDRGSPSTKMKTSSDGEHPQRRSAFERLGGRGSDLQIRVQTNSEKKRVVEIDDCQASSPQQHRIVVHQKKSKNKKSNNHKVNRLVHLSEDWDAIQRNSQHKNAAKSGRGFRVKKKLGRKDIKRFTT